MGELPIKVGLSKNLEQIETNVIKIVTDLGGIVYENGTKRIPLCAKTTLTLKTDEDLKIGDIVTVGDGTVRKGV